MTSEAWAVVAEMWRDPGIERHYGETVDLGEHMLQAAALAESEGAAPELVVAALLHDVGHLAHASMGPDERNRHHAASGSARLVDVFSSSVTEPVRLHIAAKRYLVAADAGYHDRLSAASVYTLALQGGPLDESAQAAFLADPHHGDALRLRQWDDAAKIAGLAVPGIDHYRSMIDSLSTG